jgi:hypothetical protein
MARSFPRWATVPRQAGAVIRPSPRNRLYAGRFSTANDASVPLASQRTPGRPMAGSQARADRPTPPRKAGELCFVPVAECAGAVR